MTMQEMGFAALMVMMALSVPPLIVEGIFNCWAEYRKRRAAERAEMLLRQMGPPFEGSKLSNTDSFLLFVRRQVLTARMEGKKP